VKQNPTGDQTPTARPVKWAVPDLRWVVYLTAAAVAAFAFIVSYSHIYDLGRTHAQSGTAARLLPLSVDLLIVAASLVLFIQSREPRPGAWLARWMPRLVLWAGIGGTMGANVAYGLPHGWLSAVISGWPGAAFVGVVEMVMVAVRVPVPVPAAVNGHRPLPSVREIRAVYQCSQVTAEKIRKAMRTYARTPPDVAGAVPAVPATLSGSAR
jgi:hypothetical protein